MVSSAIDENQRVDIMCWAKNSEYTNGNLIDFGWFHISDITQWYSGNLFKICNNSQSELVGCILSTKIFGSNFASLQHTIDCICYHVTVIVQINVTQ